MGHYGSCKLVFFFFQAEDGIRDYKVTGVQTCALPIYLVALTDDPVHQDPAAVLGRAVALGHVIGPAAGLRETDRLRDVLGERHRWYAVRGHLHELSGDLPAAARAYADAAGRATG